ncbi:carbohydrate ABC transporter permease [Paenibacillus sp. CECT 9249]|uniref:carbohydrate ABC transporter permease n=1 Tax=unclassified Paenibacillus TaxID=185978 RepID=UPI001C1029F4|nr:sugar ABC transporter permease [Paenibacillus sp. CECT 9249]MBU5445268.1 sugar ABC transporter permease [Paenibacillus sp. MSJ-34]CAH0121784.1 Melibiose/raffinose/stachyose import permease protein MelD [Paenibacillus sp. CECT 9249]
MIPKRLRSRAVQERITAYCFLLPDLVGLLIFVFIPIIYAFYVSLHQWDALNPMKFIGLDNYATLFKDKDWWHSVGKTLQFSVIYVPLLFCLSLGSALMLNALRGKIVSPVRTMFLLPFAITSVISAIIGMYMLDPRNGIVNELLGFVGIAPQQFLGSTSQALYSIVAILLWINIGYNMIIFLSAIKEIPKDYFEAARIDGANRWETFRSITFPLLKETSTFILVVTTIGSFQVFDQIMVMTKGGPASSTEVSVVYIFKQGFQLLNMGYSSALAFVLFLMIFVLSLIQLKLFSSKD